MSTMTELKSVLDAATDALTLHPEAGQHLVETSSDLVGACTVSSPLGEHTMTFDQAAPIGDDRGPTPGAALLAALGACQAQVYRFWSEKLGIAVDELRVDVRGDIDVRRLFGADEVVRPGFGSVDIDVHITGPESPARYEELRRAVDEHCPMLDVVANPVPVTTGIHAAS
jgi:putative redox protein